LPNFKTNKKEKAIGNGKKLNTLMQKSLPAVQEGFFIYVNRYTADTTTLL
jgi:hypothetical protein